MLEIMPMGWHSPACPNVNARKSRGHYKLPAAHVKLPALPGGSLDTPCSYRMRADHRPLVFPREPLLHTCCAMLL